MRKVLGAIGLALMLVGLPIAVAGQTAQVGEVIGDVRDTSGAMLPGTTVTLASPERGFSRTTVTDGFGKFRFSVVPLGRYDLVFTLSKFEVKKVAGSLVEAEKTTGVSVTLRLATVFGMSPRMRLDLLVNHFVYAAVTDGYIVIFEKDFKRNFIHIRDVADCMIYAIEHSEKMQGRAYNLGLDSANISKEELALKVKQYVPNFFIHFASVGSDPDKRNYIVSNQRLREAGFEARRSLDDGIKELLKGYRMMGLGRFGNV